MSCDRVGERSDADQRTLVSAKEKARSSIERADYVLVAHGGFEPPISALRGLGHPFRHVSARAIECLPVQVGANVRASKCHPLSSRVRQIGHRFGTAAS